MEELSNTQGRAARAEELSRGARDQADLQRILEDQQAPISR